MTIIKQELISKIHEQFSLILKERSQTGGVLKINRIEFFESDYKIAISNHQKFSNHIFIISKLSYKNGIVNHNFNEMIYPFDNKGCKLKLYRKNYPRKFKESLSIILNYSNSSIS